MKTKVTKRKERTRHLFRCRFHDGVAAHLIANDAAQAMRLAIAWRNKSLAISIAAGAADKYDQRSLRSVEHVAKIDSMSEAENRAS